jgi:hypothetical protein
VTVLSVLDALIENKGELSPDDAVIANYVKSRIQVGCSEKSSKCLVRSNENLDTLDPEYHDTN